MDSDSESSDFLPTVARNNKSAILQKPINKKKEQPCTNDSTEELPLSDSEEKENFPLLLVQGVSTEQEHDQRCHEERPSRRSAAKAQEKMAQVTTSDRKEPRRKRDSNVLVESDSENEEQDDAFSTDDAENSSFEEDDSEDSSLIDDNMLKKGKKGRNSTSGSKKASNARESKAKGNQSSQKKSTKARSTSTKTEKSDMSSDIPAKSIRSGLSSNNRTKLESSHTSGLLHVRPIRAGLSKKSPIPRLHTSFLNHS
ncbi:hypothetical protein GpartN1_g5167.t1 [Galdieria partita]|uniref:RAD51 interacting motif domain-containing protein n=1 Tax=Galdieria partita TaxID=83374 RepID=A0A9C7URX9_9RHOD|nr:hypothetical protein GpartN1_g5167.t1 [Galdieria partita]